MFFPKVAINKAKVNYTGDLSVVTNIDRVSCSVYKVVTLRNKFGVYNDFTLKYSVGFLEDDPICVLRQNTANKEAMLVGFLNYGTETGFLGESIHDQVTHAETAKKAQAYKPYHWAIYFAVCWFATMIASVFIEDTPALTSYSATMTAVLAGILWIRKNIAVQKYNKAVRLHQKHFSSLIKWALTPSGTDKLLKSFKYYAEKNW